MALGYDVVDAIAREHCFKPIAGDVLVIGRQDVSLPANEVAQLLGVHGIAFEPFGTGGEAADLRAAADGHERYTAEQFFRGLGATSVRAIADRPGASVDVVHDLSARLPAHLQDSADVLVDSGTLVNRFDAASTVATYAALLRPGGRLLAINTLSNHFDPYAIPSACWLLDYFVVNEFSDCRVYIVVYLPDQPANAFCIDVDCLLDPAREVRNFTSPFEMATIVFAEKGDRSTTDRRPVHRQGRSAEDWDVYRHSLRRMHQHPRPHLVRSRGDMNYFDIQGGHLFMRPDYVAVDPSSEERRLGGRDLGTIQADDSDRTSAAASVAAERGRLRIVCVGTGRDGTQSLYHMAQHLLDASGGGKAMHEYCCRELYQAFCDYRETGDSGHLAAIRRMIAECPYDCIVGNGYAAVLPLFAECYGHDLKLVHLRRADRAACVASLEENCRLFPAAYRYYSSDPDAVGKRMAGFHLEDMSRPAWDRLSIDRKFEWYYDTTHALVRQYRSLFAQSIEITTEGLNDETTRRAIAELVVGAGAAPPPKAHLNASTIDITSFPLEHQHRMHWLMGRFDLERAAADDVYPVDYFLDKFVAWTGYQIANSPQLAPSRPPSDEAIRENLDRASKSVRGRLREIDSLKTSLGGRGRRKTSP